MYIYTNRYSQVSDLTSPGLSSLGTHSSPSTSSYGAVMSQSNNHSDSNQHSLKDSSTDTSKLRFDDEYNHKLSTPNKNQGDKVALRQGTEDLDEDEDDGSYVPDTPDRKQSAAQRFLDDYLPDDSESDDDTSDSIEVLELKAPKLSAAEKERAQLKSSTARGERKRKVSSVSSSTNSSSISFSKRMKEFQQDKIQNVSNDFPFVKGTPAQDAKGIMICRPCGKEVDYIKLSTIHNHLKSRRHIEHINLHHKEISPMMKTMNAFLTEKVKCDHQKGLGTKTSIDTKTLRMKLCQGLLIDGLPFKFLDNSNPLGVGYYLRTFANVNVSYRKITDMIPDVLSLEMSAVSADLDKATAMSVIFDATPNRGEAFAVVIRYVDDQLSCHHRCICLNFYDSSFDAMDLGMIIFYLPMFTCTFFTYMYKYTISFYCLIFLCHL
jgi:hypothetical protein